MSKTKINTFKLNIVDVMYVVIFKNPCQVKMTLHPGSDANMFSAFDLSQNRRTQVPTAWE